LPQILAATVAISAISLLFLDTSREASNASKEIKKVETALKDLNKAQLEIEAQVSPGAAAEEIAESMEFAALRVQEADEEIKRIQQAIADRGGFVGEGARNQLKDLRDYRDEFQRVIDAAERLILINDDDGLIEVISPKQMELLDLLPVKLIAVKKPIQELQESTSILGESITTLSDQTITLAQTLGSAFGSMAAGASSGAEAFKGFAVDVIRSLIAIAKANVITNATSPQNLANQASGGLAAPAFALAGLSALDALLANIPALAEGGLAYGPTLAMVGDNRGANVDPEIIAPLSKLKDLIGGNAIQVYGRISGDDIVISNNRATRDRNRF